MRVVGEFAGQDVGACEGEAGAHAAEGCGAVCGVADDGDASPGP